MNKAAPSQEYDINKCPGCGSEADNGHDREVPPNPYYCTKCEAAPSQECNPHPDAPHGFARDASHNEGRYVCECEGWEPEAAPSQEPDHES